MSKGFLLVISGPSGSGKGTICTKLLRDDKELVFSVSATTRNARKGEREGVNYYFVDDEQFENMIDNGEFIEYARVHRNYYGTPKKPVSDQIARGNIVILEIDVQGALQVKKNYSEAVSIFLLPPTMEELRNRLIGRGTETEEQVDIRYRNAFKELEFVHEYDYVVINDDIMNALNEIKSIIIAEKTRVSRNKNVLENLLHGGGI
ncbi:MAG: guanylate kinase [Tissierellia bacterium]|nr:guanylate kinase [Tissierellia bacterium]